MSVTDGDREAAREILWAHQCADGPEGVRRSVFWDKCNEPMLGLIAEGRASGRAEGEAKLANLYEQAAAQVDGSAPGHEDADVILFLAWKASEKKLAQALGRVEALEAALALAEAQASMACENAPNDCRCPGCVTADSMGGDMDALLSNTGDADDGPGDMVCKAHDVPGCAECWKAEMSDTGSDDD